MFSGRISGVESLMGSGFGIGCSGWVSLGESGRGLPQSGTLARGVEACELGWASGSLGSTGSRSTDGSGLGGVCSVGWRGRCDCL